MSQSKKREKYDRKICMCLKWTLTILMKKKCLKNRAGSYATEIKGQSKRKTNSRRASGLCTYVQLWKAATTLFISTEDALILSEPHFLEKLSQKRMLKIHWMLGRLKKIK